MQINNIRMYSVISTYLRAIDNGSRFPRQSVVARELASTGHLQFVLRASVHLAETAPAS